MRVSIFSSHCNDFKDADLNRSLFVWVSYPQWLNILKWSHLVSLLVHRLILVIYHKFHTAEQIQ